VQRNKNTENILLKEEVLTYWRERRERSLLTDLCGEKKKGENQQKRNEDPKLLASYPLRRKKKEGDIILRKREQEFGKK